MSSEFQDSHEDAERRSSNGVNSADHPSSSTAVFEAEQPELAERIRSADRLLDVGQFKSAATTYEEACLSLKEMDASATPMLKHCLNNLTDAYVLQGSHELAMSTLEQLRDLEEHSSDRLFTLLRKAGDVFNSAHRYEEAEEAYAESLKMAQRMLPPDDPQVLRLSKLLDETKERRADEAARFARTAESGLSSPVDETDAPLESNSVSENHVALGTGRGETTNEISNINVPEGTNASSDNLPPPPPSLLKPKRTRKPTNYRLPTMADIKKLEMTLNEPGTHRGQIINMTMVFITVGLLAGSGGIFISMLPRHQAPPVVAEQTINPIGKTFETSDKRETIRLESANDVCTIKQNGKEVRARYTFLKGNLQELWSLFAGSMKRRELWLALKGSELIDEHGTVFYQPDAPEISTVRKMNWYLDYARRQYAQIRRYPTDAERCMLTVTDYKFNNPYTHKSDFAPIIMQSAGDTDITASPRTNGNDQRRWKPGGIYCVRVGFREFFIHGFDRDGLEITSSNSQSYNILGLHDGAVTKVLSPGVQPPPPSSVPTKPTANAKVESEKEPPQIIFVSNSLGFEQQALWLQRAIPMVLMFISAILAFVTYVCFKKKAPSKIMLACAALTIVSLICVALWYALVFQQL